LHVVDRQHTEITETPTPPHQAQEPATNHPTTPAKQDPDPKQQQNAEDAEEEDDSEDEETDAAISSGEVGLPDTPIRFRVGMKPAYSKKIKHTWMKRTLIREVFEKVQRCYLLIVLCSTSHRTGRTSTAILPGH